MSGFNQARLRLLPALEVGPDRHLTESSGTFGWPIMDACGKGASWDN